MVNLLNRLLVIVFSLAGICCGAQTIRFQHQYSIPQQSFVLNPGDLKEMPDSGFLMVTNGGNYPDSSIVVTRLNKWGNVVWAKKFRNSGDQNGGQLYGSPDEGYFLVSGDKIIRMDTAGSILWARQYSHSLTFSTLTKEGGLVVASSYPVGPDYEISVMKIDSTGAILWTTLIDTLVNSFVKGIETVQLANGSEQYMIIGVCYNEYNNYNVLSCVSQAGILQWNKLYWPNIIFYDIACSADSGIYITGGGGGTDSLAVYNGLLLMKVSAQGNTEFVKVAPGGYAWPEISTRGTDIVITGNLMTTPMSYALVMDSSFNLDFHVLYNYPTGTLYGYNEPVLLHDGGCAMLVSSHLTNFVQPKTHLIRTDANGLAGCNGAPANISWHDIDWKDSSDHYQSLLTFVTQPDTFSVTAIDVNDTITCTSVGWYEPLSTTDFTIQPNPAHGSISIRSSSTGEPVAVRIFDNQGRESLLIRNYYPGTEINVTNLAPGLYAVQINGTTVEKLVIR